MAALVSLSAHIINTLDNICRHLTLPDLSNEDKLCPAFQSNEFCCRILAISVCFIVPN